MAKESQATSNSHLWSPCGLGNTFPVNLMGAKYTATALIYLANYLIGPLATVAEESG